MNKGLKMIKFNKYIKFGGQECPPYGAFYLFKDFAKYNINIIDNKTNNK